MERVLVDRPEDNVVRVMINRPEARNAVDREVRIALIAALQTALSDPSCRALVLCGAQGIFCAGGDLGSMRDMSAEATRGRMQQGHELVQLIWDANIPIVTALEKYAVGGGAGLALMSDYIVTGKTATMAFPFLRLGLVPDWGSLQLLIRRAGWVRARQLILDCASVRGDRLMEMGLADKVVEDEQVLQLATEKAKELAQHPMLAMSRFKAVMRAYPESFLSALATEEDNQTACLLSDDFAEGLTAFQEKRPPDFLSFAQKPQDDK